MLREFGKEIHNQRIEFGKTLQTQKEKLLL